MSFMWWLPSWVALAALPDVFYVDLDQCAFGARPPDAVMFDGDVRTKKPMRLLTFNGSTFDLKYLAIHGATGLRGCRRQLL